MSLRQICARLDLGGGLIARRRRGWNNGRQKERENESEHLRAPCKNRWLQRYLSFLLTSFVRSFDQSVGGGGAACDLFLLWPNYRTSLFFPKNENNRTIIDFLERRFDVRTKKNMNKKKSLIGIHTAPDIASSAPPLQIRVTLDR